MMYKLQVKQDTGEYADASELYDNFKWLLGVARQRRGLQDKTWRILRTDDVVLATNERTPDPDPKPVSEPVAPKPAIQWLTRADFRYEEKIGNPHSKSIYSHTWGDWYFRDFHNGAYSKKSRRNSSVQAKKVTLPNTQKKSRQIANKDDKRELPRETILQIVSRIQTPLTGGARRVA